MRKHLVSGEQMKIDALQMSYARKYGDLDLSLPEILSSVCYPPRLF